MSINVERLRKNMYELAKFSDGEKGITRLSFTQTHKHATDFVKNLMEDAGFITEIDTVGNLIGRIEGKDEGIPAIVIGSHIDTVPHGGMFDGTLGVLGGVEVIKTLKENGYENKHPLEVISFVNEEGSAPSLIGGTFGSRAMMGLIDIRRDLNKNLKKVNLSENDVHSAYREPHTIKNYLELHIEQGKRLYDERIPLGIVTGIVGIWRYVAMVKGTSNHAGTTPMYARDDALLKSLPLIKGVNDIAKESDSDLVGTVGDIHVNPGVANVIPGEVEVTIELRTLEVEVIHRALSRIEEIMKEIKDTDLRKIEAKHPSLMDKNIQSKIEKACQSRDIKYKYMSSGAGHDAREVAKKVPAGMIFVPSREGISHAPGEFTDFDDIREGLTVLLESVKLLDVENT
jgi:hydantoinase/carbamoylase family amidase